MDNKTMTTSSQLICLSNLYLPKFYYRSLAKISSYTILSPYLRCSTTETMNSCHHIKSHQQILRKCQVEWRQQLL